MKQKILLDNLVLLDWDTEYDMVWISVSPSGYSCTLSVLQCVHSLVKTDTKVGHLKHNYNKCYNNISWTWPTRVNHTTLYFTSSPDQKPCHTPVDTVSYCGQRWTDYEATPGNKRNKFDNKIYHFKDWSRTYMHAIHCTYTILLFLYHKIWLNGIQVGLVCREPRGI